MGAPGPPSSAAAPGSWTVPLRQEIPLHLQLADLLVQPGDQGVVVPGLLLLTAAEDAGGAFVECFLPGLNLARVDFIPRGQLGHRFLALHRFQSLPLRRQGATLALKAGLCFLRPCDISCSFPTATAAFSLGAGLSLSYPSTFPGPLQPTISTGTMVLAVDPLSRRADRLILAKTQILCLHLDPLSYSFSFRESPQGDSNRAPVSNADGSVLQLLVRQQIHHTLVH